MTRVTRLANALEAVGCPDPRPVAVLTLEVLDQLEDDVTLAGAHLTAVRGERYGHPRANNARIWEMWQPVLEAQNPSGEQKVAMMMMLVKIARLCETPDDPDSIEDIVGYAATLQMVNGSEPSV